MEERIRNTWLKREVLIAAVIVTTLGLSSVNQARERGPLGVPKSKLDRVLRKAQERGDQSAKRVIIRTKAGKAGGVAGLLAKHGDRVESNHRLVDAITVTLHGEDLLGLEQLIDVELERPRDRSSPEFLRLRGSILEMLHFAGSARAVT